MRTCFAFVGALLLASPAFAQPPAPPNVDQPALLDLVRVLSQRLDTLTTRFDAEVDHKAVAWIDVVDEVAQNRLLVQGWGFRCDQDARLVLVVDDVETNIIPQKVARPDVNEAYLPYCPVEARPGGNMAIDLTPFEPGTKANHRHVLKFRIYDWQNLMTDSLPMTIELQAVFTGQRRTWNDGTGKDSR